ncbi:MAG: hypothetical protein ABI231_06105, partial [Candidatus Tumulicola sp.]
LRRFPDCVALHAREYPGDAGRKIDGVVASQCLMDTMGFAEGYYIRASELPVRRSLVIGQSVNKSREPATRRPCLLTG